MRKGDLNYIDNLTKIKDEGTLDKNPRAKYKDGTPAHTKFITQVFEKYSKLYDEVPSTILRETAIKSSIKEIFWIYQEQSYTNKGRYYPKWWDEWLDSNGTIGKAYAYNIESHRVGDSKKNIVQVKPRVVNESIFEKEPFVKGRAYETTANIQYIEGDIYSLNFDHNEINHLKSLWNRMFINTELIKVDKRWHNFYNFLSDVRYIPQYFLAKENDFKFWSLSKEYYNSNGYSPQTVAFILNCDESIYTSNETEVYRIIYNGLEFLSFNPSMDLYLYSIPSGDSSMERVAPTNGVFRYELSRNMVIETLNNLKKDPFGRRHIISFWNWSNINKKNLVECAYETLWTVRDVNGKYTLDMTLIQRSNDYIMAGYINKIQYYSLLEMFASHLGYEVGNFCHYVQNLHIYDRHMNACDEILSRPTEADKDKNPNIYIKPESLRKDFFEYTIEDFIIEDFDIEKIKSELEIAI